MEVVHLMGNKDQPSDSVVVLAIPHRRVFGRLRLLKKDQKAASDQGLQPDSRRRRDESSGT